MFPLVVVAIARFISAIDRYGFFHGELRHHPKIVAKSALPFDATNPK